MPARYKLLSHQKRGVVWWPMIEGQEHTVEVALGDWLGELEVYVDGAQVLHPLQTWVRFNQSGQLEEVPGNGHLVDRAFEVFTEFTIAGHQAVITSNGIFSYRHELAVDAQRVTAKQGIGPGNQV